MRVRLLLIGLLSLALYLAPQPAQANWRLGSGMSSTTGGRRIPLLYASLESKDYALSLSSIGYKNTLGYISAWNLNTFALFYSDKLLWGKLQAGAGLGFFYYEEGFKNSLDEKGTSQNNYTAGPCLRALWSFAGPFYLGLEALYGLRPQFLTHHILLSTQDTVQILVGVEF